MYAFERNTFLVCVGLNFNPYSSRIKKGFAGDSGDISNVSFKWLLVLVFSCSIPYVVF